MELWMYYKINSLSDREVQTQEELFHTLIIIAKK